MKNIRIYSLNKSPAAPAHHAIYLVEGTPEALAMSQALHSRCAGSVVALLRENFGAEVQPWPLDADTEQQAWIDKWVIGFNHKSILNGTHVTLFLENIPLYQAQLLQAHPLYRGTEKSSRFVAMSNDLDASVEQAAAWFAHEGTSEDQVRLREALRAAFTAYTEQRSSFQQAFLDQGYSATAARARACDLSRGLLPFATQTSLSLSVDLETLATMLATLRSRPDAAPLYASLREAVATFSPNTIRQADVSEAIRTPRVEEAPADLTCPQADYAPMLTQGRTRSNQRRASYDLVRFVMDYGSARDLYRHRSVHRTIALYPLHHSPAYAEGVREALGEVAAARFSQVAANLHAFLQQSFTSEQQTLLLAVSTLDTVCEVMMSGHSDNMAAVFKRRAKPDVHFTLRGVILLLAQAIENAPSIGNHDGFIALALFQAAKTPTAWERRAHADITDASGKSISADIDADADAKGETNV